jgi:hydrogenase maturation protein HypF
MHERLRIVVRGAVQGVGFRPFVYRLARQLRLDGWVLNSPQGVFIEVEGDHEALEACLVRLKRDRPPRSVIQSLEASWLDPVAYRGFEIRESTHEGATTALVLPDIAICDDCRREVHDPSDRRYRYPFTNCTNCGPRFSLIEALPYDRAQTSMHAFVMCLACQREYDDPADRRFHAQPNACPACGPHVSLWSAGGVATGARDDALRAASRAIREGQIVAVKGLGGFHLMVDGSNDVAVARLRTRKHREEKPFALMYPTLQRIARDCHVSPAEARLLLSPEAPIVLLTKRGTSVDGISDWVAPGNPSLGAMLPYTPLHDLLLADVGGPVVATSGNVSDEPICTDEHEAVDRLRGIADLFLVHDRPIVRHVDDSVARVMLGRELILRRARGYAPLPIRLPVDAPPVVAVGAHLKNTVAVTSGSNVFVSQHLGDLESRESTQAFLAALTDLEALFRVAPSAVIADLHPDYVSTRHAQSIGLPVAHVQHHYAHVVACMLDNDLDGPLTGVAWDGTGFGPDMTVWGGEFLAITDTSFTRAGCLRPFRLPGGDRAVREPRRSALGVLDALGEVADSQDAAPLKSWTDRERAVVQRALDRGINAPVTTSAGRLFDAVASLAGLRHACSFEGQAAMELEWAVDDAIVDSYPFLIDTHPERFAVGTWQAPPTVVDWAPLIYAVVDDVRAGVSAGVVAARFHNALADIVVAMAARVGHTRVVLSGGCFQNRPLTERVVGRLREAGFRPYWHQRVPPNDGGISLGQVGAYLRLTRAADRSTHREERAQCA